MPGADCKFTALRLPVLATVQTPDQAADVTQIDVFQFDMTRMVSVADVVRFQLLHFVTALLRKTVHVGDAPQVHAAAVEIDTR